MTTNPDEGHTESPTKTLEELVPSGMCIAMVNTMVGDTHTSRPVTVADTLGSRLSFLVARSSDWVTSIANQNAQVHITVANDSHSLYLSLNGTAAHAFTHIVYKSLLFMSMGAVLLRVGTVRASELGGLARSSRVDATPLLAATFISLV